MDDIKFEAQQTWKKIERESKNSGFRDGITDGRDKNFQSSFDDGFKEGFKNGFILGLYKGAVEAQNKLKNLNEPLHNLLKDATKASCVICRNDDSLNKSNDEITIEQTEELQHNLHVLSTMYPKIHFEHPEIT